MAKKQPKIEISLDSDDKTEMLESMLKKGNVTITLSPELVKKIINKVGNHFADQEDVIEIDAKGNGFNCHIELVPGK